MSVEEGGEDEENTLKEMVTKTLQGNGVLGKIQAQLRASVFLALEEELKDKDIPLVNGWTKEVLKTREGELAAALVQDFLHCLNLEFSLAVFSPESGHSALWTFPGTDALTNTLKLPSSKDTPSNGKVPLLVELLKARESHQTKDQSVAKDGGLSHSVNQRPHPGENTQQFPRPIIAPKSIPPISHVPSITTNNKLESGPSHLPKLPQDATGSSSHSSLSSTSLDFNFFDSSQKANSQKARGGMMKDDFPGTKGEFPGMKDEFPGNSRDKLSREHNGMSMDLTFMSDALAKPTEDRTNSQTDAPACDKEGSDSKGHKDEEEEEEEDASSSRQESLEKHYEDDFSSMSERDGRGDDDDDDVEDETEIEEEEVEEIEDIDEDISLDDLINSESSLGSEHTKDQSLSQASEKPTYQEDL